MADEDDHIRAHRNCIRHHAEILASTLCGCFRCLAVFEPTEIGNWLSDGPTEAEQSALCPQCCGDTVIGSASGFPITSEFLTRMKQHWCGEDSLEA